MKTERLYYDDAYRTEFRARVVERAADPWRVYLDRTAFYPSSGGQPFDTGQINGTAVADVIEEGERIAHVLSAPLDSDEAVGRIDWERRFDHMQQHSGQHLLSAVFAGEFGAPTLSFHLGAQSSTIDLALDTLSLSQLREAEDRANRIVFENRPVMIGYEEASAALDLRKASERQGILRIVSIRDFDRSACGGTHVRSTGEIGPVLIRKLDRIRGSVRVEFLCGRRAIRRARADYDALSAIGRALSAPLDETPALVVAQIERARASEKAQMKLASEVARLRGAAAWQTAEPDAGGLRRLVRRQPAGTIDEEVRAMAQGFCAQPKAVYVHAIENPPSFLLAVSGDAGIDAGAMVKRAVTAVGGRGGGSRLVAQGSVPSADALDTVLQALPLA